MNDKYIFETASARDMEFVASRDKILSVLEDMKYWFGDLCKGYDYNVRILCDGKLYTYAEYKKAEEELPKDECGLIKDCKHVYLESYLLDKIDSFLSDINHLLD